jgi:hypothetical protein
VILQHACTSRRARHSALKSSSPTAPDIWSQESNRWVGQLRQMVLSMTAVLIIFAACFCGQERLWVRCMGEIGRSLEHCGGPSSPVACQSMPVHAR